jgi:PPM family protein phosphatase
MVSSAKLRCAGDSDPGRVRANNEDRVHCDAERGIFLVVDGIGGQAAGEKAADIALDLIRSRLERRTGSPAERIREAIAVANNEIFRAARANPQWDGMACVLTVALVEGDWAYIGHVGDSRLYKIRGGQIEKITHDHSPVGEREDNRDLSETDAMRHPRRNEVFRDVGSEEHTPDDPDFIESIRIRFEPDSALLLCSDGLSDQVTSAEILRVVERDAGNPHSAVRELIGAANRAGGKDNVSVLIVEGPRFGQPGVKARLPLFAIWGPAAFLAGLAVMAAIDRLQPAPPPTPAPRMLVAGASINEALAKARAGDTVEVSVGEYQEQVHLRDGIDLVSRVPLDAILRGGVVAGNVKSGRLTGFRILGAGIVLTDSHVEVSDCEIAGAATGIEVRGGHPVIRANSIQDSLESALSVSGPSTAWVSHNDLTRNAKNPALIIRDPARPILIGNIFGGSAGDAVARPAGMDEAPIVKFNIFIKGAKP